MPCARAATGASPDAATPAAPATNRVFLMKSLRSLPACMTLPSAHETDCIKSSSRPAASNGALIGLDVELAHEPRVGVGVAPKNAGEIVRRAADRLGRGL